MTSDPAADNTAVAELLATIGDRRIKRKVQKLLQHGEEAVRALGELDSALYLREDGEQQLQIVADAVLSHFRRLLEYIVMVMPAASATGDSGETDAPAAPLPASSGIIAQRSRSADDRWNMLETEMASFQYGLAYQLREFERRFAHALAYDNREQAVRDLNDATTGLMDGVFAVLTTVYECFLGYAEPERMVPGHRDSLGKALAVRRALAALRHEVRTRNHTLQNRVASLATAEVEYRRIVAATLAFIESDSFSYLRSDTRNDFWQFADVLANGNAARNRLDCEGFDKYLDSLSFVSQRGVLIKHDSDVKNKITVELDRAVKFAAVLPDVVCDVIEQSFVKAEQLTGMSDELDELLLEWSSFVAKNRHDVDLAVTLSRKLLAYVRPVVRPTTSSDDLDVL